MQKVRPKPNDHEIPNAFNDWAIFEPAVAKLTHRESIHKRLVVKQSSFNAKYKGLKGLNTNLQIKKLELYKQKIFG